jgi:hypothetical protein
MASSEWGEFEWGEGEWGGIAAAAGGGAHPVGVLTQLAPAGIPGRRYGSFAGKAGTGPTFQSAWARNANALIGAGKIG